LIVVLLTLPLRLHAQDKPRVVATIFPLADIVRQLGGEAVEVVTLLPSGASPHTFEPTPAQMRQIAGAALVVRIGAGLDDWSLKLLASIRPAPPVVTASEGLSLLDADAADPHGHGADPHVWLDPLLVRDQLVPRLTAALTQLAPDREEMLRQAAARYQAALSQTDAEVTQTLAAISQRKFIAFHSAWRYFARRYRLEQVAVVEESPGKEPSARAMARLVDVARRDGVRAILVEPQYSPRVATQVASDIQGTVATVDPLGSAETAGRNTYLDLMRFNAKAFAEALR